MKEQILAVQRMQDYIEAHLEEEITLADLAGASLFSPWYSYRLFRQYTGLTPADYIRRLRLSESALRLKAGHCKVIDAACELGFGSVDGYQRAFLREFGCNPGQYARTRMPIPLFIPYGVKFRELRKDSTDMKRYRAYLFSCCTRVHARSFSSGAFRPRTISPIAARWAATSGAC